ncbi:cysteine synthase A [Peredibacter starrii]|uniref:Cysteine synthase n=1 Tax=Peredibacter starrii TaxID=28202 RepID=A0AAX4HJ62_9BACT|nr:cysteine synthase A [Peredibacter starrii]WPU63266.1 cysteine synthase A [Peredibacter starrii]
MKGQSILDVIGNTPHVKINRLYGQSEVWMKLERQNPGASIKDRIALSMIAEAEKRGDLKPGMTIIEPTSGNTGIGLAMVCAVKGYKLILVMPESMSVERRKVMAAYGATFELTPKEKGIKGSIARAQELFGTTPNSWIPMQFENKDNVKVHAETTAQEILKDFPDGFDYLVTGVGTGGHITAVGKVLKEKFPKLKVIAVEPADSAVLSGGQPGPHPLQGIGTGFVPSILDRSVIDQVITITKEEAFEMAQRSAKEEGIFVGISSGASLAAVKKVLAKSPGKVLTFCYDTGERYLSIPGLFETP